MQLTPHFTLEELSVSQLATRRGIDNTPPPAARIALKALAENILEPLRKKAGKPVFVSSAFRCKELNNRIGGAPDSQHCDGEAADITLKGISPYTTAQMIVAMGLPFDQLILEFGRWVHVSHNPIGAQRGQILTAVSKNGHTHYEPGLHNY